MDLLDALEKILSARPGIDPWAFQLEVQRLNHYATPGPVLSINTYKLTEKIYF